MTSATISDAQIMLLRTHIRTANGVDPELAAETQAMCKLALSSLSSEDTRRAARLRCAEICAQLEQQQANRQMRAVMTFAGLTTRQKAVALHVAGRCSDGIFYWYRARSNGERVTLASLFRKRILTRRAWRGEEGSPDAAHEYRPTPEFYAMHLLAGAM